MRITLLQGGFKLLESDHELQVPESGRRVLAFLSVEDGAVDRTRVGGSLWPDLSERRAQGNLRTALWRIRRVASTIMVVRRASLRLAPDVEVDLRRAEALCRGVLADASTETTHHRIELLQAHDVLDGWSEIWLYEARERFRQLRLQALETLAMRLASQGRFGEAIDCALASLASDPVRESAHATVIRVHLEQGNRTDALRQFESYQLIMRTELDLPPSVDLVALVRGVRA